MQKKIPDGTFNNSMNNEWMDPMAFLIVKSQFDEAIDEIADDDEYPNNDLKDEERID